MKKCPFCSSDIPEYATTCRFCGERLDGPRGYGSPGYGPPGYGAAAVQPSQSSGVLTLVMGILGLFCFPFGVVALILWISHRGKVSRGLARPDGTVTAGMAIGVVGLVLQLIMIIFVVATFLMMSNLFYEGMAVGGLEAIHESQEMYKRANGQYASSFAELRSYNLEGIEELTSMSGYTFELDGKSWQWSCIARPTDPTSNLRYLYIDQDGVVRASETPDVGPHSPKHSFPDDFGSSSSYEGG